MISDEQVQLALRAKLLTLVIAQTGAVSLSASASGGDRGSSAYIRAAGSFLIDGLRIGLEVVAAGFAALSGSNNGPATIRHISADGRTLSVNRKLYDEVAAAGRSLVAGVPKMVSWENVTFRQAKAAGRPFMLEQYLPGPARQVTGGSQGLILNYPQYVPTFYFPKGGDIGADSKAGDAMRVLFAPGTSIPVVGQPQPLIVRRDVAPEKSQRQFAVDGYVGIVFPIPVQLYSPNTI